MAKFGTVTYKLQLPALSHIHLVFHVSLLKKSVGVQPVSPTLSDLISEAPPLAELALILDKRVIYKQGAPLTQVLVQWTHLHPTTCGNISLIYYSSFRRRPGFFPFLEDKKVLNGG